MRVNGFILIIFFTSTVTALAQSEEASFVYSDRGKRDPLWPLVTATGGVMNYDTEVFVSDMILEGIIMGAQGQGNLAIINGLIVKPHDLIGQYAVAEITPGSVVLIKGQERFILKLKKEE